MYYNVKASDACGATLDVVPGERDNRGKGCSGSPLIITRTYTATDAGRNSTTVSHKITIEDKTAPTIGLPTASLDPWPYGPPVRLQKIQQARGLPPPLIPANDNCGQAGLKPTFVKDVDRGGSGLYRDPQKYERYWKVSDTCGNLSQETVIQQIHVELDQVKVTLKCEDRTKTSAVCIATVEDSDAQQALARLRSAGGQWGYYWYIKGQGLQAGGDRIITSPREKDVDITVRLMIRPAGQAWIQIPSGAKALEDDELSAPGRTIQLAQYEAGRGSTILKGTGEQPQKKTQTTQKTKPQIETRKYGPFAVPWGSWFSTGVAVKKGESFRTKATGAYRSVNQNTDVKTCGPDGCGHWRWFVLKAKIASQMMDVGSDGGGTANQDGVIELGSPRGGQFVADDAGNCTGSLSVEVWVDHKVR